MRWISTNWSSNPGRRKGRATPGDIELNVNDDYLAGELLERADVAQALTIFRSAARGPTSSLGWCRRVLLRDAATGDALGVLHPGTNAVWGLGDVLLTGGRRHRIVEMFELSPERDDIVGLWFVERVEPVFTDQPPAAPDAPPSPFLRRAGGDH